MPDWVKFVCYGKEISFFFFYYAKQCLIALVLKQRDVALRRLQINEFKDLLGLVFISAFLASAGRNLPELSYLSKVISC